MTRFGYFLSSEEHDPLREFVRQARLAEQAGFDGLWISDHFHPWLDEQGQSGFVWSMIGAISQACLAAGDPAVTCPLSRMHPAIVAQAAATSALLTGGRFTLGVGTGEALNEHVVGGPSPPAEERLEMLDEAVARHPGAVDRQAGHPRGRALHRADGPAVLGARRSAAGLHVRVRGEVRRACWPAGSRTATSTSARR